MEAKLLRIFSVETFFFSILSQLDMVFTALEDQGFLKLLSQKG